MTTPRREIGETLQSYLATHDAKCDWCGYGLRGVETNKCPECGGPLDLDFVKNPPSEQQPPPGTPEYAARPARKANLVTAAVVVGIAVVGLCVAVLIGGR